MEDPDRPMYQQVEEAAEVCRRAKSLGFSVIYAPQHYISHPTVWMQPMQTLARLAPDAEGLKLLTGVLLLPYHNPVDLAEQTVTLDHISNGRFVLGVGIGYRIAELSAFGTNRRDRVSRFEESLELMKLLWSGEEVNFDGKHWQVQNAKLGLTPVQKPHPPIWVAAQSRGAVRRAAALADRVVLGPQPGWNDVGTLTRQYKEALDELGKDSAGRIGAHRSIAIAGTGKRPSPRPGRWLPRKRACTAHSTCRKIPRWISDLAASASCPIGRWPVARRTVPKSSTAARKRRAWTT